MRFIRRIAILFMRLSFAAFAFCKNTLCRKELSTEGSSVVGVTWLLKGEECVLRREEYVLRRGEECVLRGGEECVLTTGEDSILVSVEDETSKRGEDCNSKSGDD